MLAMISFDPVRGPARERLDESVFQQYQRRGTAVIDERRRRPLYFDGRFLAARDLTREQNYFLTRQADLAHAAGIGVVAGLMVDHDNSATRIVISAGHGITPSGEVVTLGQDLTVDLADIPEIQRLDAQFGLLPIPKEPARNRSGLYVVGLRAVEYSAGPVATYPTSLEGRSRTAQDGEIVEGVVVTLVPYPDSGARDDLSLRRARAARDTFVYRGTRSLATPVLPLAMVALERGLLRWVDPFLVRREVGAERGSVLGLGIVPRALAEAHLLHYEQHLQDVLEQRRAGNRGYRFAASESFACLPPVGRMPAASIDGDSFTQIYFPPEVDVSMSIVPEDEVAVLVEESLSLPPLDLGLGSEQLATSSFLVLVPVKRDRLGDFRARLSSLTRRLRPAAPGLLALRRPVDVLRTIQPAATAPAIDPASIANAAWQEALGNAPLLWFVRRRNLQSKPALFGQAVAPQPAGAIEQEELATSLRNLGMEPQWKLIHERTVEKLQPELIWRFPWARLLQNRTVTWGAVCELVLAAQNNNNLAQSELIAISRRYADPQLGAGITRLALIEPAFLEARQELARLAMSRVIPEIDRAARATSQVALRDLAKDLLEIAAPTGDFAKIREAVLERLRKVPV